MESLPAVNGNIWLQNLAIDLYSKSSEHDI